MEECTITMYVDTLNKIIHILERQTELLNDFDDIEEIVNIIHHLQKEVYKEQEEGFL